MDLEALAAAAGKPIDSGMNCTTDYGAHIYHLPTCLLLGLLHTHGLIYCSHQTGTTTDTAAGTTRTDRPITTAARPMRADRN